MSLRFPGSQGMVGALINLLPSAVVVTSTFTDGDVGLSASLDGVVGLSASLGSVAATIEDGGSVADDGVTKSLTSVGCASVVVLPHRQGKKLSTLNFIKASTSQCEQHSNTSDNKVIAIAFDCIVSNLIRVSESIDCRFTDWCIFIRRREKKIYDLRSPSGCRPAWIHPNYNITLHALYKINVALHFDKPFALISLLATKYLLSAYTCLAYTLTYLLMFVVTLFSYFVYYITINSLLNLSLVITHPPSPGPHL